MGCFLSRRTFVVNENIEGQDNVVLELCSELGLTTSDINILYTAFWDIDADGSGTIAQAELFAYFEVESTPFERNIFGLFDEDNSGIINFMEFIASMWNLLTLPHEKLGSLFFLLKDRTGSKKIFLKEIKEILIIMLAKSNDQDIAIQGICELLLKDLPDCTRKSKGVDIEMFTEWVASTTAFNLTTHMTILQLHLRTKIIGESYWLRLTEDRSKDPEMQKVDFIPKLQRKLVIQKEEFRVKKEILTRENARLERRGLGVYGDHRDLVRKNESMLVDFFKLSTPSFRKLRDKAHQHKAPTDLPMQRKPRQRRSSSFYILQKPKLVRKEHLELRQKRRKDLGIRDPLPSTKKNNNKGSKSSSGKRVHAAEEFDINNPKD